MVEYKKHRLKKTCDTVLALLLSSVLLISSPLDDHISMKYHFLSNLLYEVEFWVGEQLWLIVHPNGSVSVGISTYTDKLLVDVSHIKEAFNGIAIKCRIDGKLTLSIGIDLNKMSLERARLESSEIVDRLSSIFNMDFKLVKEKRLEFTTLMGRKINRIFFRYEPVKIDYERLIDVFMNIKPNEGFASLLRRRDIEKNTILKISIRHFIQTGEIKTELYFFKTIPSYFNFKPGGTYVLNIFKLFNHTGSITSHSSLDTLFWIYFDYTYGMNYKFTKIEIPVYYKIHHIESGREYMFTNHPWYPPRGTKIDHMIIEFKVVEFGFKLTPSSMQLIGYLILIFILIFLIFIFYHFGLFSKIIKSLAML